MSGMMDSFAVSVSLGLQSGVELKDYVRKFRNVKFEPMGVTGNKEIPFADSIVDYIFRWMEMRFLGEREEGGGREKHDPGG